LSLLLIFLTIVSVHKVKLILSDLILAVILPLPDVRLPHWNRSSGMWCYVTGWQNSGQPWTDWLLEIKTPHYLEMLEPLAPWHNTVSQRIWILRSGFCPSQA